MYRTLRLVLGDQLDLQHSWFARTSDDVLYVIAELHDEASYVRHHIRKLCAFFAAMRAFADELQEAGHQVEYLTLDDTATWPDLPALLANLCERHGVVEFEYQQPDEYRLSEQLRQLALPPAIKVTAVPGQHFMLPFDEIQDYFPASKHVRMESFYRKMRRRFDILMQGDAPLGERWNFDAENRNRLTPQDIAEVPAPLMFATDVSGILARIERHGIDHFGTAATSLPWPVTRDEALASLAYFCDHCLPRFGHFQDAMTMHGPWSASLYHSRLSFALNTKLLNPREIIDAAIDAFEQRPGEISLAQVEGFVRQVLGWREYVRGVYWANMPGYDTLNVLNAERPLPAYFWTGNTRMNCVHQVVTQSLELAYAHHIQRLMITGNFALLAGVDPAEVDEWYLGIYIDAIQWVELPNTRGMSQFADGGLIATKPYAASANYVNKMSDYCRGCYYSQKQHTGSRACPLNSMYWHFLHRHRERFETNPRIGMLYRNWDKRDASAREAILAHAQHCIDSLETL